MYLTEKKIHGSEKGGRGNQYTKVVSPHSEDLPKIQKTSQKIAAQTGVSRQTIERDAQLAKAIDSICEVSGADSKQYLYDERINKKDIIALAKLCDDYPEYVQNAMVGIAKAIDAICDVAGAIQSRTST